MARSPAGMAFFAPLLMRNLVSLVFVYADKPLHKLGEKLRPLRIARRLAVFADKPLHDLGEKFKPLRILRPVAASTFHYSVSFLTSVLSSLDPSDRSHDHAVLNPAKADAAWAPPFAAGDSGIARALSQLLSIMNEIPVRSRKYEVVQSLADRLIAENHEEGFKSLRTVNTAALTAAFSKTLSQLEAATAEQGAEFNAGLDEGGTNPWKSHWLSRVIRAIRHCGDAVRAMFGWPRVTRTRSAEKLAAELLWLAQKLVASGGAEEAVCKWASASNLAWLALSAEPRLQGMLVKVSAFLIKQAKEMGVNEACDKAKMEQLRQAKAKLLSSWLPFLCRAGSGADAPALSLTEKAEIEVVLAEIVDSLGSEEEQEKVLSLWLHHFTRCPSSDWPNLHACYSQWCTSSRRLLALQSK